MISKYIFPVVFIFSLSCNGQAIKEKDDLTSAKWYYYSYAMQLNTYDKTGEVVNFLECDIKLLKQIGINTDTVKYYFQPSYKDSINLCFFKPYELVGITAIKNKYFVPIYHLIVFDKKSDSAILDEMNKQTLSLQTQISQNREMTNSWLRAEAERRK